MYALMQGNQAVQKDDLFSDDFGDVDQGIIAALDPLQELVASSQSFSKAAVENSTSDESDPMDFDNKVAESIAHLMPFLISFTRSMFHPSLARLVHHYQFLLLWDLTIKMTATMVMTKTLASVTIRLLIILLFEHAHLTAFGNPLLHLHVKSQHLSSPMHRLLKCNPLSNC